MDTVRLIPYKHVSFSVLLTRAEAKELLAKSLFKKPLFSFWKPSEGYDGLVYEKWFVITRNISGRDSFLPSCIGRFVENKDGTQVDVRIVAPAILIFAPIMIFFVLVLLLGPLPLNLVFLPFLFLFSGFFIYEFNNEVPKAEQFFTGIFGKYLAK